MIIALPPRHAIAVELATLCAEIRKIRRGESPPENSSLIDAMNLTETLHGSQSATYLLLPGKADSDSAISAYRHIKSNYPGVLQLLCMIAEQEAAEVTIEVGTLNRRDHITYSHHSMLTIMPRILAAFRGLSTST